LPPGVIQTPNWKLPGTRDFSSKSWPSALMQIPRSSTRMKHVRFTVTGTDAPGAVAK
jgi:hypothetical protein